MPEPVDRVVQQGPRSIGSWGLFVRAVFTPLWLAAVWFLRAIWAVAYWTMIVIVGLAVVGWSAVEVAVHEFSRVLVDGVCSPSAILHLPRNLLAFSRRRQRTRAAMRRSLRYWSESNVIGIIRQLQDLPFEDVGPSALARAAWSASQLRDPRAAPYILPLLGHPDENVLWAAITALDACGFHEAEPSLIALLDEHDSALVRMSAASSLGRLGATDALDAVRRRAREDPDDDVRLPAWQALSEFGEPPPDAVVESELQVARARRWSLRKGALITDWQALAGGVAGPST